MKIDHQSFQGMSQKLSLLEPIKLGRVRSVRLTWSFPLSPPPPPPPPRSIRLTWSFAHSPHSPYQVKLLCPKLGGEFARAGSSGVSLLAGLAIILLAASLASLGLVWKRLRRKKDFAEGREETEELHSCEILERERGLSEDWTVNTELFLLHVIQKQNGLPQLSSTSFNLVLQLATTPSKELAQNTIIADQVANRLHIFNFFRCRYFKANHKACLCIDSSKGML